MSHKTRGHAGQPHKGEPCRPPGAPPAPPAGAAAGRDSASALGWGEIFLEHVSGSLPNATVPRYIDEGFM